jgi:thiol-disulfide isomerase/thioredoxin
MTKRFVFFLALIACSRRETPKPEAPSGPRLEIVHAEPGEVVAQQIVRERAKAEQRGRKLLVYIGATWCEPCQRFHHAAESGALDKEFPTLTLLEYDLDVDGSRLSKAGYAPGYIPYFGVPGPDGKATTRAVSGSIKGEGAVNDITPKLHALLEEGAL